MVILDSLNYIKGHRYELYCISKAAGERHGVVWIMGSAFDERGSRGETMSESDVLAARRNRERMELDKAREQPSGDYYEEHIIEELVARYEPPDERNRWENPLYKVDVSSLLPWDENGTLKEPVIDTDGSEERMIQKLPSVQLDNDVPKKQQVKSASGFKRNKKVKSQTTTDPASDKSTQSTTCTSAQASGPMSMAARNLSTNTNSNANSTSAKHQTIEETIDSILNSFLSIQPLKEGLSTAHHASAESNVLNTVDSITMRVNSEIMRMQKLKSTDNNRITIDIGNKERLLIQRDWNVTELRNFRTQFLKWTASHPSGGNEGEIVENYLAYIESSVCGKDS